MSISRKDIPKDPLQNFLFQEKLLQAHQANVQRAGDIIGAQDLSKIPWPKDPSAIPGDPNPPLLPYYGYDHAKQTSQLAVYIAQSMDPKVYGTFKPRDFDVIKTAGLLHDLGRTTPWQAANVGHASRGAVIANRVFHDDAKAWGDQGFAADVCQLIATHRLPPVGGADDVPRPTDPRLIALWDAECYEAARFVPNTPEGGKILAARMKMCITPWAREVGNQKRWRVYRGWK